MRSRRLAHIRPATPQLAMVDHNGADEQVVGATQNTLTDNGILADAVFADCSLVSRVVETELSGQTNVYQSS
ncbi:MAG TPA: hypothetical protein VHX68_09965 [Planctomycetaceae bacterium]|nr:hypothetical protein [Planctomycetaceae bacterium]